MSAHLQAITALLEEVEANHGSVQVILAGYPDEMQRLMRTDPGLTSRFPTRIHIDDYTLRNWLKFPGDTPPKKALRLSGGLDLDWKSMSSTSTKIRAKMGMLA